MGTFKHLAHPRLRVQRALADDLRLCYVDLLFLFVSFRFVLCAPSLAGPQHAYEICWATKRMKSKVYIAVIDRLPVLVVDVLGGINQTFD